MTEIVGPGALVVEGRSLARRDLDSTQPRIRSLEVADRSLARRTFEGSNPRFHDHDDRKTRSRWRDFFVIAARERSLVVGDG
jgi:hypothetical protein